MLAQAELAATVKDQLDEMTTANRARQEHAAASRQHLRAEGIAIRNEARKMTRLNRDLHDIKERKRLRATWRDVMAELVDRAIKKGTVQKRRRRSRKTE